MDNSREFTHEKLEVVYHATERTAIVVEHRQYKGGSSPERRIFYAYSDFCAYVAENVCAGDKLRVWSFELLTLANVLVAGTVPDDRGFVPITGSY